MKEQYLLWKDNVNKSDNECEGDECYSESRPTIG